MANWNRVTLMGNLTRDVESRTTQGGMVVGKFGMAVNRKQKEMEHTCFVDCTAFGKSAELISQYCQRGSPLFIEGRLEFSQWDDKTTGAKRSKLEVVVENFQFLSGDSDKSAKPSRPKPAKEDDYGDIPF